MESWTNNTPKKNAGNLKTKAMDSGPALHPRSPVGSIRDNLKPQLWYAKHFSPKLNRWQVAKLASKIFRLAEGMQAAICQRKRQWFLMRNWNVSSTYFGGFGNTVTWTSGGITASHTQMASSSCVPNSCNCRDAGIKLVVGLDTHTNNRPGSSWHDIWKAPFMWPAEGGWFSILSRTRQFDLVDVCWYRISLSSVHSWAGTNHGGDVTSQMALLQLRAKHLCPIASQDTLVPTRQVSHTAGFTGALVFPLY